MKKSLFVTIMITICCGVLWISFLAATNQIPVLDINEMAYIKGGTAPDPFQPDRKTTVQPYYIDKYEVTNRQFQRFFPDYKFSEGMEDYPVTGITLGEAKTYARLANKRLPTMAEWLWAADIPYENLLSPISSIATLTDSTPVQRVGLQKEKRNSFGCYDMYGNVWEWTSNDLNSAVLLGGSLGQENVWSHKQLNLPANTRSSIVGFRCVRSKDKKLKKS